MSLQTSLSFPIRKNFYGIKESPKVEYTTIPLSKTPSRYTPTVKKIVDISESESSSDSEDENVNSNLRTPKRKQDSSNVCSEASPPKQKKVTFTPKTPSTLLDKLTLLSPTSASPGILKQEKLAPKKLFSNKYSDARKALHSTLPENLIGRDTEMTELENFIDKHMTNQSSASLYVSGPPGTGKTACLSKIMLKPKFKKAFQIVYVNCTSMKSAAAIYSAIIEELGIEKPKSSKSNKSVIEKYLKGAHKMLLLVLDEMDQLESKNQAVLYSIFEWPSIPDTKLILVGIANALDLTDRILPRLQARCELKPTLLHFKPYTKQQIMEIITERLKEANVLDIFTSTAMQLLSGKVAAVSGDIRKALDIGRRVIEIAESQKMLQSTQNSNSDDNNKNGDDAIRKVDFQEVRSVLNGVYGGSQNVDKAENEFPLQQKLLLCSLMLILNRGRNKNVTVGMLHQVYRKVCDKRKINKLDMSEFVSLCSLIETRGIVKIISKKEARLSKVSLEWDQELLTSALQDKVLSSDIINDVSCL
ncbi:hypothetical protein TKK_0008466 [Trichogramma kaykai]|uniref:Cell division control protein n=1 Tax=Trichogramma kaykai TaxID=54128 RepID=A0ABD2X6H8_9HYME